ncbi:MAG: hypothetical protein IK081_02180 [Lachnospiraceae bacterium]|nr:hypothetical protein [Lachnospiraceae bacterium]
MERVLRGEEISRLMNAACSLEGNVFYFPVRHHSPACSLHLKRVIASYQPDCILIEGPENANDLTDDMTDPATQAPFCIYYSYRDKKGLIDENNGDYRCYYPFLDTSPELVALREGRAAGIPARFMDLPFEEILIAEKEGKGLRKQDEKNSYNDDAYLSENAFIQGVVERSGFRSFDEFWERHFEMQGMIGETEEFLADVLHYCVLSRANTGVETMEEDGCLAREAYMRTQIADALGNHQKVLVVTGGFHVAGLVDPVRWLLREEENAIAIGGDLFGNEIPQGLLARHAENKLHSIDAQDKGVYLMSYSMEAADRLNGYCSGMPHPMFYQRIWEELQECQREADSEKVRKLQASGERQASVENELQEKEFRENDNDVRNIYEQVILQFLVEVGKRVRQKEGYPSTFDEICALTMCLNLARLRGKPFPGVYELTDAVLSNYVKGEYQLATDRPMRVLRERLTGNRIGKLLESAKLPPLCNDFEKLCHTYRLDVHASTRKELTLSLFGKKRHREISAFLYRMDFLGTDFAVRKKGPNLRLRKDRNLIREIWEYNYKPQVTSTLIEASVYGGTLEEACRSLVDKQFQEETDAGAASSLVVRMFEMDLDFGKAGIWEKLSEIIQASEDFFSLTKTFSNLGMLIDVKELYGYETDLIPLRDLVVQKLLALLGHLTNVKDEDAQKVLEALKELYRTFLRSHMAEEQGYFIEILGKMSKSADLNALLSGGVNGLLFAYGELSSEEIAETTRGYLLASGEKAGKAADFVRGLFYVARDVIFAWEGMIDMLDDFLLRTEYEDFLKILPQLRLAFSFFTPTEMDRLASKVARKYGLKTAEFEDLKAVSAEEFAYGKALEERILQKHMA